MGIIGSITSLVVILTVVIVIFVHFRKNIFGVFGEAGTGLSEFFGEAGTGLSEFFGNTGSGITDFFSNLGASFSQDSRISPIPSQQTDEEQETLFGKTLTDEEEQIQETIAEAIENEDPDTIRDIITSQEGGDTLARDFNPPGVFGYGFLGKDKRGISDTLARELGIYDKSTLSFSDREMSILSGFDNTISTTNILADESLVDRNRLFSIFRIPFTDTTKEKPLAKNQQRQSTRNIPVKEPITNRAGKGFQVFSSGKNKVEGKITETPVFRKRARNVNNQISASKRASQAFEETGRFIDQNRGASAPKEFNFGTNTGKAPKISTTNTAGSTVSGNTRRQRIQARKEEEARKAEALFEQLYGRVR